MAGTTLMWPKPPLTASPASGAVGVARCRANVEEARGPLDAAVGVAVTERGAVIELADSAPAVFEVAR